MASLKYAVVILGFVARCMGYCVWGCYLVLELYLLVDFNAFMDSFFPGMMI